MIDSPHPRQPPRDDLVVNFKGVALAAFAHVETIQRILGCTALEAQQFQSRAVIDFQRMMAGRA